MSDIRLQNSLSSHAALERERLEREYYYAREKYISAQRESQKKRWRELAERARHELALRGVYVAEVVR